jgi:anti-anti-sigma regulatory factor
MTEIAPHWVLHVDVGPEWLFFRLGKSSQDADPSPPLAQRAWDVLDEHHMYRAVVELESDVALSSHLIGQLVLLHKRCHRAGGVMRICGLNPIAYDVLKIMRLDERFPNYPSRQDAVMGNKPAN